MENLATRAVRSVAIALVAATMALSLPAQGATPPRLVGHLDWAGAGGDAAPPPAPLPMRQQLALGASEVAGLFLPVGIALAMDGRDADVSGGRGIAVLGAANLVAAWLIDEGTARERTADVFTNAGFEGLLGALGFVVADLVTRDFDLRVPLALLGGSAAVLGIGIACGGLDPPAARARPVAPATAK